MVSSYRDWIVETSNTTGTGNYSLSGSAPVGTSYFRFRDRFNSGNTQIVYWVVNADRTKWEKNRFGTLTYGSPDSLTRNVVESTNGDAAVPWVGGDVPLRLYVTQDSETAQLALDAVHSVVRQVFTSSGTYTPTSGMVFCVIRAWGAGGGGGGSAVQTSGGFGSSGGGGGSGSNSETYATEADIGASKAVTIGAAGAAGAAGNNAGGAGGDTSVGTLCIGKGGSGGGGNSGAGVAVATAGAGGVAGTGDVVGTGQPGFPGSTAGVAAAAILIGGGGSTSVGGGAPVIATTSATSITGTAGSGRGSGGGGGYSPNGGTAAAGGAGTAGYVVITEYVKG